MGTAVIAGTMRSSSINNNELMIIVIIQTESAQQHSVLRLSFSIMSPNFNNAIYLLLVLLTYNNFIFFSFLFGKAYDSSACL